MTHYIAEYDHDYAQELAEISRAQRRYYRQLGNHPDPRDPDYPEMDDDEGEDE